MRAAAAMVCCALVWASVAHAQSASGDQRTAEQRLRQVRSELHDVSKQRRTLATQRSDVTQQLRTADERVGSAQRTLQHTRSQLQAGEQQLQQLRTQRASYSGDLQARKAELARLLRAAQAAGDAAPLKALLSQDRVAASERELVYTGYLQRAQVARMRTLTTEIAAINALEANITKQRTELDAAHRAQVQQLASLQTARSDREKTLAGIDRQYHDRATREKALGQDAKALQSLIARLRAEAAKAAREAAAEKARRRAANGRTATARTPASSSRRTTVARAPALAVGGLSWPATGNLLAAYGGRLPDGRRSDGVLIAAAAGAPVKAVADGTVVFADWMTGYGNILIIDHGNGYMSLYAHNDALLRSVGTTVKRGEQVASVGSSGGQSVPALYFELRRNGSPVNPATWLTRQ